MGKFIVRPKYQMPLPSSEHDFIESAIVEGRRLHELNHTDMIILEIVGEIKFSQIVKEVTEISIDERLKKEDIPPFP